MIQIQPADFARMRRMRTEMIVDPRTLGRGPYGGPERRVNPRVYEGFSVRIWSTDGRGRKFEIELQAGDISSGGICVRLPDQVEVGEELLALIRFSTATRERAARVAGCGIVVRSRRSDHPSDHAVDEWETAVKFEGHVVV